jgi:hypothetical protein
MPRIYAASGGWRFFIILCSILITGGAVAGLGYVLFSAHTESPGWRVFMAALSLAFILLGMSASATVFRCKLILFADRIRVQGLVTVREFARQELRGWRILPSSPTTLVLQPKDPTAKPAKIGLTFSIDDELSNWLDAVPCLDTMDAEASADEILMDDRLGLTESERTKNYDQAGKLSRMTSFVAITATLWAIFYPHPYQPLILGLIVLPWIGVIIMGRSKGLIRADEIRNDAHPSVAFAIMFPGLALALRAVMDTDVIESALVPVLCFSVGSAFILVVIKFDPTVWRRRASLAGLAFAGLAYSYGAVIESNVVLDRSSPAYYAATVQNKHVVNGKHNEYKLTLAPWGPKIGVNDLEVRPETYGAIQIGDVVQLGLRKGALGIRWYYLHDWRRAGEQPN